MTKLSSLLLAATLLFLSPASALAAEFHAGETVRLTGDQSLNNAYVTGSNISLTQPVQNDLTIAGGEVNINSQIDGGLLAAGGTVIIDGQVGRSARVAGGEVTINGLITQDLVVAGGNVTLNNTAEVRGDVVFTGGQLTINAPVTGAIIANCSCNITINSQVGSVDASRVGVLRFGSNAVVNQGVTYASNQQAITESGSSINGAVEHNQLTSQSFSQQFNSFSFFYGLLASAIFAFFLLFFFRKMIDTVIRSLHRSALGTFGLGLGNLLLLPSLSLILLLVSAWLGIGGFVLYLLLMIVAFGLAQIIIGWWLLQWWLGRNQEVYQLDWRAPAIGVLATTTLIYVPVLGWFIIFVAILFALGGLTYSLWQLRSPLAE